MISPHDWKLNAEGQFHREAALRQRGRTPGGEPPRGACHRLGPAVPPGKRASRARGVRADPGDAGAALTGVVARGFASPTLGFMSLARCRRDLRFVCENQLASL